MRDTIICAGFGGQGIMILGKIIAYGAMEAGLNVTWMPSYGAEVRGGTAHCMIIISDKEIASPMVSKPDTLIAMNQPSLDKFLPRLKKNSLLIANSSLSNAPDMKRGIDIINIPISEMAHAIGSVRVGNIIALGAYITHRRVFTREVAIKGIRIAFAGKNEIIDMNIKALEQGLSY